MAGYSGTPLVRKLGIKAGQRVALVGAPKGFELTLGELPEGARPVARGGFDVAVAFFRSKKELAKKLDALRGRLDDAGGLWIAWPKKSSGVPSDVDESVVRKLGLDAGLVDNKVCAIDEVWSGLRFVVRVKDRKPS